MSVKLLECFRVSLACSVVWCCACLSTISDDGGHGSTGHNLHETTGQDTEPPQSKEAFVRDIAKRIAAEQETHRQQINRPDPNPDTDTENRSESTDTPPPPLPEPSIVGALEITSGSSPRSLHLIGPGEEAVEAETPFSGWLPVGLWTVEAGSGDEEDEPYRVHLLIEPEEMAVVAIPEQDGSAHDSIVIAGQRYVLGGGVHVITFDEPGGWSFYEIDEKYKKYASRKYRKRGYFLTRIGEPESLDELKKQVHMVVLHADVTPSSEACYILLLRRGYSTHFLIDADGVVYQTMDVLHGAKHAREVNEFSVGVDLNNLVEVRLYEKYFKGVPENRPIEEMTINGLPRQGVGYTDDQYRSLIALARILVVVLGIPPEIPLDEDEALIADQLESPLDFTGFVGHWHVSSNKWDPGPAFDWERFLHGLGSLR